MLCVRYGALHLLECRLAVRPEAEENGARLVPSPVEVEPPWGLDEHAELGGDGDGRERESNVEGHAERLLRVGAEGARRGKGDERRDQRAEVHCLSGDWRKDPLQRLKSDSMTARAWRGATSAT